VIDCNHKSFINLNLKNLDGKPHTSVSESFKAGFHSDYPSVIHCISEADSYGNMNEIAGISSICNLKAINMMETMITGADGEKLTYSIGSS